MTQTPSFADHIVAVPDFPKPGILFRDVTPVLADPHALQQCISMLHQAMDAWPTGPIQTVAGIESRGFIFGVPAALAAKAAFVPVRKSGRLPRRTVSARYHKEYGPDTLEIHVEDVQPGTRVLIVDDLLATGGTAEAAARLVTECGGRVAGFLFVVELEGLGGRAALEHLGPVQSLLRY